MRYVLRSLAKAPGFTVIAILTLALGIGANTAVFSVVNGVLLRPLPYPHTERIIQIWRVSLDDTPGAFSAPDYLDFQRSTQTVAILAGYREEPATVAPWQGDPVRMTGAQVTTEFFDVFGMPPALGRTFSRTAGDGSGEPRAVLGHAVWRDQFGSDPDIIGKQARINTVTHTIVGVMPAAFDYPLDARVWTVSSKPVPLPPMEVPGDILEIRDVAYFNVVGLLKPGVDASQAQADFAAISQGISARFPRNSEGRGARVERLHDEVVGDARRGLLVLLGAVAVVLLIACANVASLLLARASGRQRELAVRAALGASRGRLIRHLLAESVVLATAGGVLGMLIGIWTVALLVSVMPAGIPRIDEIRLDARVAAVCLGVSLLSAALFGLVPSLQASRADAAAALRESGDRATTGGRGRAHTRSALVVSEIALTLVLLVVAGLLANSFIRLQRTDSGMLIQQVTLAEFPLPQGKYSDGKLQAGFYNRLLEVLQARGEIQQAAVAFPRPFGGGSASGAFFIEGLAAPTRADQPTANFVSVSADYLNVLGIPLVAGRHLTPHDREPAAANVLVNAAFVRRYLTGRDPVGTRIRFEETDDEWMTIVGVAADTRAIGLDATPAPTMYIPYSYFTLPFMTVVAKSAGGPAAVASAVRAAVKEIDPDLPIDRVRPLQEVVHDSVAGPRFRALLLAAFAATALVLAMIGVYGLVSYSVAQRTREIGIRVALGATSSQVVGPIVRHGMTLAVIGVVLGLAASLVATRALDALLFGVDAKDPTTFIAVSALLLAVALAASYIPSRRALKVDAITALRAE